MTKTKKKAILMTTNVESTDYSVNVHNHLIFYSLFFHNLKNRRKAAG